MDPISLTVISTIVLGTGALITKGLRAQKKNVSRFLQAILPEHGFQRQTGGFHGQIAGNPCTVTVSAGGKALITVHFSPSLDLGLLAHDNPTNTLFEVPFPDDLAFAGGYEVVALEPARAYQLFNNEIRRLLTKTAYMDNIRVEDSFFRTTISGIAATEQKLRERMLRVFDFVERFESVRQSVSVAAALKHMEPRWRALATKQGWRFGTTPLHMVGQVDAGEVRIQMTLIRQSVQSGNNTTCRDHQYVQSGNNTSYRYHYEREATLRFLDPLALGLTVAPKTWAGQTAEWFGGQDIKTGDALFDDTFRVQAEDVEGAKRVLSAAVRARLLLIQHDIDPIRLDDDGLTFREKHDATRPEEMVKLVPALEKLARLIQEARTARGDQEQGPYR
ncbi:MAG: hypothetical protein VB934_20860 [Polyangiaceae bacterium]